MHIPWSCASEGLPRTLPENTAGGHYAPSLETNISGVPDKCPTPINLWLTNITHIYLTMSVTGHVFQEWSPPTDNSSDSRS